MLFRKILSSSSDDDNDNDDVERVKPVNDWKPSYWRPDLPVTTNLNHQNNHRRYQNTNHHQMHISSNEIRNTALQKYTPSNNNWHQPKYPKPQTPWISKLQQTMKSFETRIKDNVNKLFDNSFPIKRYDGVGEAIYSPKYNPNRQGLLAITNGISPIAAILSSLVTSVGITSLVFAREFVFGDATAEVTAPFRAVFLAGVEALGDVLTTGIQSFLYLDGFDGTTTTITPITIATTAGKFF